MVGCKTRSNTSVKKKIRAVWVYINNFDVRAIRWSFSYCTLVAATLSQDRIFLIRWFEWRNLFNAIVRVSYFPRRSIDEYMYVIDWMTQQVSCQSTIVCSAKLFRMIRQGIIFHFLSTLTLLFTDNKMFCMALCHVTARNLWELSGAIRHLVLLTLEK